MAASEQLRKRLTRIDSLLERLPLLRGRLRAELSDAVAAEQADTEERKAEGVTVVDGVAYYSSRWYRLKGEARHRFIAAGSEHGPILAAWHLVEHRANGHYERIGGEGSLPIEVQLELVRRFRFMHEGITPRMRIKFGIQEGL